MRAEAGSEERGASNEKRKARSEKRMRTIKEDITAPRFIAKSLTTTIKLLTKKNPDQPHATNVNTHCNNACGITQTIYKEE